MRRMLLLPSIVALLVASIGISMPAVTAATSAGIGVSAPSVARRGQVTAVRVTLPASVAAVDGRILLAKRAGTLIGVAVRGSGIGLRPVAIADGFAFGAYGLKASGGNVVVDLVVLPRKRGSLQARVIIDATSSRDGQRLDLSGTDHLTSIDIAGNGTRQLAPSAGARPTPTAVAQDTQELVPDGRINRRDLDTARADWELARAKGRVCSLGVRFDTNQDGCVDIVDIQATLAAQGRYVSLDAGTTSVAAGKAAAAAGNYTYVVTSAADTADANRGNGICADSQGRCTLRAAMAEADYIKGDDRIVFNIPGGAPVLIQLNSRLPIIASRSGTVTIDAYTQPGASVNTAASGSNAVPGVEIRGNGQSAREVGLYITSPRNTIRGFAFQNLWRAIVLDGINANGNRILGNWLGFKGDGTNAGGQYGMVINVGAHDNFIGSADRADRNLIGNWQAGIDEFGPGVDGNVVKGNLFCIRPNGGTATCGTGIDHNFGPKNGVIGGDGPGEANVFGPTTLQGIELSHGWNQSIGRTDTATTYQINGNKVTGNWVGFRADGSYAPAYRSGQNASTADNAQGINVYDGVYDNIVQHNYVGSVYDGIQLMANNAQHNTIRGNIIGVSPLGENAPMSGWGIVVRWATKYDVVSNNTIRNTGKGGIGLLKVNQAGSSQAPAYNVRISRNIVTDTSGPAIDLFGIAGADPNDAGDADKGANSLLNTPVIGAASTAVVSGTAVKGATVEVYRATRAAGAFGLPVEFLGDTTVASNGTWNVPVSTLQAGDQVTALQIAKDDNTSELSANVLVTQAPPPPGPGDLVAADDFGRTVSGGWGTASNGPAWTLAGGAADFSVGSGTGRVSVAAGQGREARLAVGMADVAVLGQVTVDRLPSSGNIFAYVLARQNGTSAYRATIRINPSGTVFVQFKKSLSGVESNVAGEVATGITLAPGATLAFRFRVSGSDLKFRVWDTSGAEPDWQTTTSDTSLTNAGGTGFRTYVGAPVPNGPVTFTLDALEVRVPS